MSWTDDDVDLPTSITELTHALQALREGGQPSAHTIAGTEGHGALTLPGLLGAPAERRLGMSFPNDGIERDVWNEAVESARRAGYDPVRRAENRAAVQHYRAAARAFRERPPERNRGPLSVGSRLTTGVGEERNERMASTILRRPRRQIIGFDPTDIEPPGGADDHIWERLGGGAIDSSDEDDPEWGAFSGTAPVGEYAPGQQILLDLFEVDGWGSPPDAGATLARGRFNRRRASRGEDGRRQRTRARDDDGMNSEGEVKRRRHAEPVLPPNAERPAYISLTTLPAGTPLPVMFEMPPRSRDPLLTSFLDLTVEDREGAWRPVITFRPEQGDRLLKADTDACSLRTSVPIPLGVGVFYYEVEILNSGDQGHISIGWTVPECDHRRLVGWNAGSWGWHADDGKTFEGRGDGRDFSDPWKTGDVVGCGIDMTIGRAFFTRNGNLLGHAFSNMLHGLYPAVGMRNEEESVAVNLTGPFQYDIVEHVLGVRNKLRAALAPQHEAFSDVPQAVPVPKLVGLPSVSSSTSSPTASSRPSPKPSPRLSEPEAVLLSKLKAKLKLRTREDTPFAAPPSSPFYRGPDRAAAALVLDYLAFNGHSRVHSLVTRDMRTRGWLPPRDSPEPVPPSEIPGPSATKDAYATVNDAIRAAVDALVAGEIRWPLIHSLGGAGDLSRRLEVYAFATEAQAIAGRFSIDDDSDDDEVTTIAIGQELDRRSRAESWPAADTRLLGRANRQIALPDDSLDDDRRADAARLGRLLRDTAGIQRQSCLHLAVAQTGLVHEVLIERGDEATAFMGLGAVLK
ncbi:hypothetical protein CspeluHIS016_0108050 [Cutaneotrichosporon spelunceum]|uniref:B30.2/SPRY domain-containing protein n=1 Tax=Cutaneotrichosporon spelunceum TaxID=1672016 RepID=A0AAD3YA04_9TREE|nr:hypothetical protein CspeluHIS016_0108050 [Cutaneotrichosporon spelunceum]